ALLPWETREHVRNISALAVGGFAAPEEPRSRPVHVPLEPATDAVHSPMSAEVKLNVRETRRDKAGRWLAIGVSGLRIRERHCSLDRGALGWPKPARE